jgi:hypothetical protein
MSEFKPIIADSTKDINKPKKVKSKILTKNIKKPKLIIEDDEEVVNFVRQVTRKDVLANMLKNTSLTGEEILNLIITDNNDMNTNPGRQGWLYESLWQILISVKCVNGINYTQILDGQLDNLRELKNINNLLKIKIAGGGNNITDFTIKNGETIIPFSIKYKDGFKESDVTKIDNTIKTHQKITEYKIAFITKDKEVVKKHKFKNNTNIDKIILDSVIENNLLFDQSDLIKALDVFRSRVPENLLEIDDFIDFVNAEYLFSERKQLVLKLHQKMTEIKFKNSFLNNKHRIWCISHKPRSGKSITILTICNYLLKNDLSKILIMTSVPATIESFVNDLENYVDFKKINYKRQEEFGTIDESFNGIVFCSVQFLKTDGKIAKKDQLKKIGFDLIITDECHLGGSTDKTKSEIIDVDGDIEDIRKNIKLTIFASGTASKTIKYYGIKSANVFEWEIMDEGHMKELLRTNALNDNIIEFMVKRHGPVFMECLENETLDKDYSKHPAQILIKHSIDTELIKKIDEYNKIHGTNFGYSSSSLFAQSKSKKSEPERDKNGNVIKTKDGNDYYEYVYDEEFELAKTEDGKDILNWFFDYIISNNKMKGANNPQHKTIMKKIEEVQFANKSRQSTKQNPMLFIIYLPTHTGNNTIAGLQKTFKSYLESQKLWSDYNIEYSNSIDDSGSITEEYNESIKSMMTRTKAYNKRGCILLLGNKGSVGITYDDCDVTISLDDGHNLDNQQQRFSRSLTAAKGKTIGINVDMNIQRTYLYLLDVIHKHRKTTQTTKTNAEILHYLFEHNIFLFNPNEFNNGKMTSVEILSYYQKEAENIMKEIDDTPLLENLSCQDDMRDMLKKMIVDLKKNQKQNNNDLEGDQQDCPKGEKTKFEVDAPYVDPDLEKEDNEKDKEITEKEIVLINKTLELCKYFIPYLAMISKSFKIGDFKEILVSEITKPLIISFLEYKKIELNKDDYIIVVNIMNNIIDNDTEIVNNIREIYSIAPATKLRELIEKHFKPTDDEKKQSGEVSTPLILVDDMLNSPPVEFYTKPQKVLEPCCGKGQIVLGLFDKFYKGLEELYPDEIERCRVIMTECIYYADIAALNVFITTEILKCHIQSYCGLDEMDFEFNNYTGDTLELNITDKWNISGFNMVSGNPPYNSSGDTGTGNTIWQDFTKKALNEWLLPNGYLLFVHPPGWRKPNTERGKFTKMFDLMTNQNQMVYLEIHGIKDGQKMFNCGTRYDWYLIEKTNKYKNTIIVDEDGKRDEINLSELSWLPNSDLEYVKKILAKENNVCNVLQSTSLYESRKKWMSHTQNNDYKYPCVHSTTKKGVRFMYSKLNDKGHFGIPKVIFGDSGINDPIIDINGDYGMTEHAIGIIIDTLEEGESLKKVLKSCIFNKILNACMFSSFAIDRVLFKEFKKDFWKEFI